jgi:hypothetical protein
VVEAVERRGAEQTPPQHGLGIDDELGWSRRLGFAKGGEQRLGCLPAPVVLDNLASREFGLFPFHGVIKRPGVKPRDMLFN